MAARLYELALDAKKALGVLTVVEGAAVAQGLLSSEQAGLVTGGIGAVASVVAYILSNEKAPTSGRHERPRA